MKKKKGMKSKYPLITTEYITRGFRTTGNINLLVSISKNSFISFIQYISTNMYARIVNETPANFKI